VTPTSPTGTRRKGPQSVIIHDLPVAISTALTIPAAQTRAGQWFLHSGIQEPDGGVARYYRIDTARNARISTEITGYAISALCFLHSSSGDSAYLDAARRAGNFLVDRAWSDSLGLPPFEWPPSDKPEENRAYFFDCGIIIRGLIHLYHSTGESRFLRSAEACGHAMARLFERNGEYAPILQLPDADPLPYGNSWSNNPGCYQLKSALGWYELFLETGDSFFQALFETALGRALENDLSFLPGTPDRQGVMDRLHSYSYFLEALLAVNDRPECAAAQRNGLNRAATLLREIAPEFARSDVYAQVLRVRLLSPGPVDEQAAAEEAAAIAAFQIESADSRLNGGFYFGRRNGAMSPFANPVSTAFCTQALAMWHSFRQGSAAGNWRELI
jgi:hypothetical protein